MEGYTRSSLSIAWTLVVAWLIIDGELWDRPDDNSAQARERSRLYNTSTVVTLTTGVLICYLALYVVNLVWALFVFVLVPTGILVQVRAGAGRGSARCLDGCGAQPRAGRDVGHAGQLEVLAVDADELHRLADDRVAQLGGVLHPLELRVLDDPVGDERLVERDVDVAVDGGGDEEAAVLFVVGREVGPPAADHESAVAGMEVDVVRPGPHPVGHLVELLRLEQRERRLAGPEAERVAAGFPSPGSERW